MSLVMGWLTLGLTLTSAVNAITVTSSSSSSIKSAAAEIAYGMMAYYTGNDTGATIGNLPSPYYWWEAGAMFGTIVEYYYYTGDDTYNDETIEAITFQAGSTGDFMPANQTKDEGNDDQVFWAFAAMSAAELGFPAPPSTNPSWLSMAQAVFNEQASRWDDSTCGGGLRWQIFTWNNGYTYKNVASNGGFFQLASRLARYTGNDTYTDWAEKAWTWFSDSVLFDADTYAIYDGTSDTDNCTSADHTQWSYNYGMYISGLSYLYNYTEKAEYLTALEGIINQTITTFFPTDNNKIMIEVACETIGTCDADDFCFKGFTLRWMAITTQLVPALKATIEPYIQASGVGAAGQCDGGTSGTVCGFEWNTTVYDGLYGVGEQMSALSAVQANMLFVDDSLAAPLTATTGGNSTSDPSAGTSTSSDSDESSALTGTITAGDKAGAAILTIIVVVALVGGAGWMLFFD